MAVDEGVEGAVLEQALRLAHGCVGRTATFRAEGCEAGARERRRAASGSLHGLGRRAAGLVAMGGGAASDHLGGWWLVAGGFGDRRLHSRGRWYNASMELTREDIAAAVASIVAGYDVQAVYLFGSFARGDQELGSDVDLRFACGPAMDYGALYRLSQQLEGALGRSVEIVTNPPRFMRSAFRERVQHDEVLLYEAA